MADVIIRRTGIWSVELMRPLMHNGRSIDQIDIKPPRWDHQIRLAQQEITSMLGLLSEMTGLPEKLLRELTYPDVDVVMLAFHNVLPPIMRDNFQSGQYSLATPAEELPEAATPEQQVVDQEDPRFPKADGPVKRFSAPPKLAFPETEPEQEPEVAGLGIDAPPVMKQVG